ncbi:MAG TPA: VWA domain-containing protein, partial [Blastocatellia bacterium]|nr:VWA domain-containing protein [Blastocatellia bacterium]
YVPQLSEGDFLLYEDGTQQQVAFFTNEEVPFNVALVLDMSPSTADNQSEIQDAALAFVRQLRPQDRVMVVSFDKSVSYLTDFTSNRRELESAIRSTNTGSGTSVYDAVYETVNRRMARLEGRKAMILFSDGEDTTSNHASYDEAINAVTESDVLVYGLRYPGGGSINVSPWPRGRNPIPNIQFPFPFPWPRRRRGPFGHLNPVPNNGGAIYAAPPQRNRRSNGDFMEDLATAGGGPVYNAENIRDLSSLATKIADELRHVYVVSYYPTNPLTNGGHRSIQIRVKGRSDIAVRHRRGYNARDVNRAPGT